MEQDSELTEEHYKRYLELIDDTPSGCREVVDAYHAQIIQGIDSGKVIVVPSFHHRLLHQAMWLRAHEIYNGLAREKGQVSFITEELTRFNVWYAKQYISNPQSDWALETRERAEKDSMRRFGKSLTEVCIAAA